MIDLIYYLTAPLYDEFYALPEEYRQVCVCAICVAVPLMLLCAVLGFIVLAVASAFHFVTGDKKK